MELEGFHPLMCLEPHLLWGRGIEHRPFKGNQGR